MWQDYTFIKAASQFNSGKIIRVAGFQSLSRQAINHSLVVEAQYLSKDKNTDV